MSINEYEIIDKFECCGVKMVIVRLPESAHIMPLKEWRNVYRRLHPVKRKNEKKYKKQGKKNKRKIA